MIIVSDTTPIISLIKADHLELLEQLFQEVMVPEAVYHRAYWSGDCKEAGRWPGRKRDSGPYGI